jgi:hypothetical protein
MRNVINVTYPVSTINKYTKPCGGFTVPPHTKHYGLQQ